MLLNRDKLRQCGPVWSECGFTFFLTSCAKILCVVISQVSALQADIKSLKTNITESTRNEQKALADCRTLQDALKDMGSLESVLQKKDSHIKNLEMEVRASFTSNLSSKNAEIINVEQD